MLCFSLPPSGLNAGAFYALSTLLNRMVILHYPVREFPKHAGSENELSKSVPAGARAAVSSWCPAVLGSMLMVVCLWDLEGDGPESQPQL